MSMTFQQIATTDPSVIAFRITADLDVAALAERVNAAFDAHDAVALLLIFDRAQDAGPSPFRFESLRAHLRGLGKLRRYAVVGAPESLEDFLATAGAWTGIETGSFDLSEEQAAWRFVGAQVANA